MTVVIAGQSAQLLSELGKANRSLANFEKSIDKMGKAAVVAFAADKIYSGLEYGVGVMKDFERQMDTVAAISGATGKDLQQLQDNAVKLAGAFRSIDIAKMETELARLGFSTKEIINSTKAIIDLATATGEDLAKSSEIVGSTLRIFNLDAAESGRVAESMAIGFNTSALALDNFGEAMKYVGPVANAANLSLEQTTALLGVLADNGIKGSMAGTSLRKIISDLGQGAAPVLNQRLQEMAAAGLDGADAMDEVGRTAYASLLILAKNTEKIDDAVRAQREMKGALEATSKIMQDNLQGDVDKLNAAWDQMFIETSRISPLLRKIVQETTGVIKVFSGADREINQARGAFNAFFGSFNYDEARRTADGVKLLEKLAVEAGYQVGFVWDETGEKIKKAFRIETTSGSYGPFQSGSADVPFFLKPPVVEQSIRSVSAIKKEIEDLNTKIEASGSRSQIEGYTRKIIRLKDELDKLLGVYNSPSFQEAFGQDSSAFINKAFDPNQFFNPTIPTGLDLSFGVDSEAEQNELNKSMEYFDQWVSNRQDGYEKVARSTAIASDALSDLLVTSISDGESFGRQLIRQTDRIVSELYRQAVAYQLAKAAKDSLYNPLAAIFGLTAGLVAFKTAFAASTKSVNSRATGANLMAIPVEVQFRGDAGKVLEGISINNERRNGRTKA